MVESAADAIRMMLDALKFCRACKDPYACSWSFGHFPPDDGSTHEVPVLPRGHFGLAA